MKTALCQISIFLCGVLPCLAQGDSSATSARSAWFACTSIPDGVPDPIKVVTGKKITELSLPRYMASEAVRIPIDGLISVVREKPGIDPKKAAELGFGTGPAEFIVLAQARVPENIREALIILTPLEEPKDGLVFEAKIQNLANFKGGDRLYINQSNSPIRVSLGQTKVNIPPGEARIYEAPNLAKPTNMPIIYNVYDSETKRWKLFSASTVVLRPTRRQISIFNTGSRPGNIKKHGILFPLEREEP